MNPYELTARRITWQALETAVARTLSLLLDENGTGRNRWYAQLDPDSRAACNSTLYAVAHRSMELTVDSLRAEGAAERELVLESTSNLLEDDHISEHPTIDEEQLEGPFEHLPAHGHPALDLGLALYRTKPEMLTVFPDVDSMEFARWLQVDAYLSYPAIRALLPPVPPAEMRDVVSTAGLPGFLDAGFASASMVRDALSRHGADAPRGDAVLDFGCGCGRVLRLLVNMLRGRSFHGCDIDRRAIEWCTENLSRVSFMRSATRPRLPYDDAEFGAIYSISVFSHLSEENHFEWLTELARITRPGAVVILTTHGPHALEKIRGDAAASGNVGLELAQVEDAANAMTRSGYAFVRQPKLAHDTDLYGMTFIDPGYVERNWTRDFDLLEHAPGGLQSWQDVVVLRRR